MASHEMTSQIDEFQFEHDQYNNWLIFHFGQPKYMAGVSNERLHENKLPCITGET